MNKPKNKIKIEHSESDSVSGAVQKFKSYEEWKDACDFMTDEEKELFKNVIGENAEYTIF